jgi:hypothetical protein
MRKLGLLTRLSQHWAKPAGGRKLSLSMTARLTELEQSPDGLRREKSTFPPKKIKVKRLLETEHSRSAREITFSG